MAARGVSNTGTPSASAWTPFPARAGLLRQTTAHVDAAPAERLTRNTPTTQEARLFDRDGLDCGGIIGLMTLPP